MRSRLSTTAAVRLILTNSSTKLVRSQGSGSGDHVLEVGCGSGQLTRGLLARGLHVTALEPGKSLITLARQNLEVLERWNL